MQSKRGDYRKIGKNLLSLFLSLITTGTKGHEFGDIRRQVFRAKLCNRSSQEAASPRTRRYAACNVRYGFQLRANVTYLTSQQMSLLYPEMTQLFQRKFSTSVYTLLKLYARDVSGGLSCLNLHWTF
jgi:hypothetical protein